MQTPVNPFKQAIHNQQTQIGLWVSMANPYSIEICAGAGFDWLLLDGEHAPNDLRSLMAQLHVVAGYPGTHAVARVPVGDTALIKQYLDLGVQTLLVPMVDTPEQVKPEWVAGKPETLVAIVLHGINGTLSVKGTTYNGAMPAFKDQVQDAEIAAVLTHVRGTWGNQSPVIDTDIVAKVRKDTAAQAEPYKGDADLKALE